MKKFLLMLAAVALTSSAMLAQTNVNNATVEEPDRVQLKATMSRNPTGTDLATGMDKPQQQVKHECKDHKDGQPCTKPADQQCPDCKAKAAEGKKCEKAEGMKCEKGEGPKHECKEGMKDCKKAEGMKHECKDHKDGQACNKPADQQCPDCKDKAKKN